MKQREFPFLVASDVTHYREQTFILYIRRYQWPLLDLKQTSVSTVLPHVLQFQKLANCTYKIAWLSNDRFCLRNPFQKSLYMYYFNSRSAQTS